MFVLAIAVGLIVAAAGETTLEACKSAETCFMDEIRNCPNITESASKSMEAESGEKVDEMKACVDPKLIAAGISIEPASDDECHLGVIMEACAAAGFVPEDGAGKGKGKGNGKGKGKEKGKGKGKGKGSKGVSGSASGSGSGSASGSGEWDQPPKEVMACMESVMEDEPEKMAAYKCFHKAGKKCLQDRTQTIAGCTMNDQPVCDPEVAKILKECLKEVDA